MMIQSTILLFSVFIHVYTIPVDNGVEGEPEIECGPTSVSINVNTRNGFHGHVYVKGFYDHNECRTNGDERQVAGIEIPIDSCNVARSRSLNPRGIFVTAVVVITFHPQFITKVDRAYRIQCFYMEADKTVSTEIEVSDMTTLFQTQLVPMPVCRYEILQDGPTGTPVKFATIGEPVYHKWTCDSETINTFCATVHSCTVDDGNENTVQILDENGCALDKYLLNNLEYLTDLMAGQEAHVYKYADRSELYYQCQISITVKELNNECPRPQCSEPQGFGIVKSAAAPAPAASALSPRNVRLVRKRSADYNTMDVRTDYSVLDITEQNAVLPDIIRSLQQSAAVQDSMIPSYLIQSRITFCIAPLGITILLSLFIIILIITCIFFTTLIIQSNKKK